MLRIIGVEKAIISRMIGKDGCRQRAALHFQRRYDWQGHGYGTAPESAEIIDYRNLLLTIM